MTDDLPPASEPAPPLATLDDALLVRQVFTHYHRRLLTTPTVQEWLAKRGMHAPGFIEQFTLGYCDRAGAGLLVGDEKGGVRTRLRRLGLVRPSGFQTLLGHITVPLIDAAGAVPVAFNFMLRDALHETWWPRDAGGVWNAGGFAAGEAILAWDFADAACIWCAGYRHVTATWRQARPGAALLAALQAAQVCTVFIAFPRQDGDPDAQAAAATLTAAGIACWRVPTAEGIGLMPYLSRRLPAKGIVDRWMQRAERMDGAMATVLAAPPAEPTGDAEPTADEGPPALPMAAAGEADPSTPPPADEPVPATLELAAPTVERRGDDLLVTCGDRAYRIRGLDKDHPVDALRVNVRVATGDRFHLDTVDLYNARQRAAFVNAAAAEIAVKPAIVKRDLGRLLIVLEDLIATQRQAEAAPAPAPQLRMTPDEEADARAFLRDPALLDRILADFDRCEIVGETVNKLVGYVAATSRKLNEPLAVVIQSSSAAGKTSLMDAILAFVPPEDLVQFSAMTGQSLWYMGEHGLRHRVLAISEDVGAEKVAYALKLLQSEGELRIASTGKDSHTGRLEAQTYTVQGPTMLFFTTTAIDLDEELLNRCLVLTVDEDREQTRAVHAAQRRRKTLDGLLAGGERAAILTRHRNAQRLLEPLPVVNPFAPQLIFPDHCTRTRRDHAKYLSLIQAVTLLFQHQRTVYTTERDGRTVRYLEAIPADIAMANRLADAVLGRCLDELPPQTRQLLLRIEAMVAAEVANRCVDRSEVRFTRRELRERLAWGDTALKIHLRRLVDHEYLVVHRGDRGQRFAYELAYDGRGKDGGRFLNGLTDPATLVRAGTDAGHGPVGGRSAGGQPGPADASPGNDTGSATGGRDPGNAQPGGGAHHD